MRAVSPIARIALIWLTLLGLLALTVGASLLSLGPFAPALSYGIAAGKAALILWFFMEMRSEHPLPRLVTVAAFVWIAILLILTGTDYAARDRADPAAAAAFDHSERD